MFTFAMAAEYDLKSGDKVVYFAPEAKAADYKMIFTVTGRWAEIDMSPSMQWSASQGEGKSYISDCSGTVKEEVYSFTGTTDPYTSSLMYGDGWFGKVYECGGSGSGPPPPDNFNVDIGEGLDFKVKVPPPPDSDLTEGETSALVGQRIQLQGYLFYTGESDDDTPVESDWKNVPMNATLYDSDGDALSGTGLENVLNLFAEVNRPGSYTFKATPHAEPEGGRSGEEKLTFHSLDLDIEGVDDTDEEDPGSIIVGTNNLQKIKLALSPDRYLEKDLTLKVKEGKGIVKIWGDEYRTEKVLDETESEHTWNYLETAHNPMYVEFLSTSSTNKAVNLELSYAGYGGNTNGVDRIKFNRLNVEIVEDSTTVYNFSPSLSEESKIRVNISPTPPEGGFTGLYFKLQIVRETESGADQPIAWVNVTDVPDSYGAARVVNFDSELFKWDGIPEVLFGSSAPATEGLKEFNGVSGSINCTLSAVSLDEALPPPEYTIVATIRNISDGSIVAEDRMKLLVPQVVKMVYDEEAVTALRSKMTNPDGPPNLFEEMSDADWNNFRNQFHGDIETYFGDKVNIRVVDSSDNPRSPYSTLQMKTIIVNAFGFTDVTDFPNVNPQDEATLAILSFRDSMTNEYFTDETMSLPILSSELRFALAKVGAHEIGHMLGLVKEGSILNGSSIGHKDHNKPPFVQREMMNPGTDSWEALFGRDGVWDWRELNKFYIEFVLPVN